MGRIMRTILSYILFKIGDLISPLAARFGFFYHAYTKIMFWSICIDNKEKVWKNPNDTL